MTPGNRAITVAILATIAPGGAFAGSLEGSDALTQLINEVQKTCTVPNGGVTLCPNIDSLTAGPLETDVGKQIDLSAQASDFEGDVMEYLWTASAGSFANKDAAATTYTCTVAGSQTITLTAWDGLCPTTKDVPVVCNALPTGAPSFHASAPWSGK
jgi:hypothetical protein